MLQTLTSRRGMVTAPHHLAAQAGVAVMRDGGNAIEAMVAAASTIAVVYPHMNSICGDGFWLISEPGKPPVAIDACGRAALRATPAFYRDRGCAAIPSRGPFAANTVAGAISGWRTALALGGGTLPLARLLEDATWYATHGAPVTRSQTAYTTRFLGELAPHHVASEARGRGRRHEDRALAVGPAEDVRDGGGEVRRDAHKVRRHAERRHLGADRCAVRVRALQRDQSRGHAERARPAQVVERHAADDRLGDHHLVREVGLVAGLGQHAHGEEEVDDVAPAAHDELGRRREEAP